MFGACDYSFLTLAQGNCRQHGVNKTELRLVKQRIKDPLPSNPRQEMKLQDQSKNWSSNRTVLLH
jgi:hypothetical protein